MERELARLGLAAWSYFKQKAVHNAPSSSIQMDSWAFEWGTKQNMGSHAGEMAANYKQFINSSHFSFGQQYPYLTSGSKKFGFKFFSWPRSTTRMPNGRPLNVHLFAISKDITTFGASSTRRMEVIVPSLQHFACDVQFTVMTLDAEQLLIVLLAVHLAILVQVFAVQDNVARFTLEAPDVPVLVQRNQCLSVRYGLGTWVAN